MEENEIIEDNDSENVEEEVVEEVEEEVVEEADERDAKIEALEKENKTLKIQKAKNREKSEKKVEEKPTEDISTKDLYSLMSAEVVEEDVSEVVDYAKFKGISVAEALKTETIKSILEGKKEARNVAQATNTGSSKKGTSSVSGEDILANANKGKLPESDEDFAKLAQARIDALKARN